MTRRVVFVLCSIYLGLLALLQFSECANIVIIEGLPSPSHHVWMRTINHALAKRGHNVTALSVDVDENPPANLTYLHMETAYQVMDSGVLEFDLFDFADIGFLIKFYGYVSWTAQIDQVNRESKGFQQIMAYPDDFKVDLIIYDHLTAPGLLVLAEKFNHPKMISASAYPGIYVTNPMSGGPEFAPFVPNLHMEDVDERFCSRLESFITYLVQHLYDNWYLLPKLTRDLRKLYPNMKPLDEVLRTTRLQLVNYNPSLDFVQPIMPSVIPVGGLQISEPKELPKDLQEIFNSAKKGVILFSLGSNVKSELLGMARLTEIIEALRTFEDYNFIWKIDDSGLNLELPSNVYIRKWLPQNDILAHKKTVLFMSHAGGLSTQESTWFGVPMIGMPIIADQFPNIEKAVKSGMALRYDIRYVDRESMKEAINEMLTKKKYKEKALIRSKNFRDQPEKPLDRALWWIDYVLRNDDISFLKNPVLPKLSYFAKHSWDVITFVTVILVLFIILLAHGIMFIVRKTKVKSSLKSEAKGKDKKYN